MDIKIEIEIYCILWIEIMPSWQKLGIILENKVFRKCQKKLSWTISSSQLPMATPRIQFNESWIIDEKTDDSKNLSQKSWKTTYVQRQLQLKNVSRILK